MGYVLFFFYFKFAILLIFDLVFLLEITRFVARRVQKNVNFKILSWYLLTQCTSQVENNSFFKKKSGTDASMELNESGTLMNRLLGLTKYRSYIIYPVITLLRKVPQ